MEERNWEYRGLQISNKNKLYNFQVTNVDNIVNYTSEVYNNRNNNGSYSTNVTAGARLFSFTGQIYGNKTQKELAYKNLKQIIKTEDFPSIENKGFYDLKRTDKRGVDVQVKAKVYEPLKTREIRHDKLEFEFTLLAEDSFYFSQEEKTANGGLGLLGGNTLPNILPNTLFGGTDYIELENKGDSKAGMYIQVIGDLVNPRITNITTGQTMKINGNTSKLVVDNREKPFIITDNGISIKAQQTGQFVSLVAGINQIIISAENYINNDQAQVYIKYRDTFE